ncbi:MAG: hypothetical protein ABSD62_06990 [Candidatus Limnocylindrales bacterium]
MYYSTEIVKLLMEERLREAQDARRASSLCGSRVPAALRRLFVPAQTPAPCAC